MFSIDYFEKINAQSRTQNPRKTASEKGTYVKQMFKRRKRESEVGKLTSKWDVERRKIWLSSEYLTFILQSISDWWTVFHEN